MLTYGQKINGSSGHVHPHNECRCPSCCTPAPTRSTPARVAGKKETAEGLEDYFRSDGSPRPTEGRKMTDELTCSQCGMPIDPDQVGLVDNDGDVTCLECLDADSDTE